MNPSAATADPRPATATPADRSSLYRDGYTTGLLWARVLAPADLARLKAARASLGLERSPWLSGFVAAVLRR